MAEVPALVPRICGPRLVFVPVDPSFSSLLRTLRRRAGLTQEEVAQRAGLSPRAIGDLERGLVRRPQRKTVELLIRALELPAAAANSLSEAARRPAQPVESVADADPGATDSGAAPTVPRQLPIAVQHFTGRREQLRTLDQWIAGQSAHGGSDPAVRVLAVDGMAGIGKTALVIELGHAVAERYPDGQLFLDLHGHTPDRAPLAPRVALLRLLRAFDVREDRLADDPDELAQLWRSEAAGRRLLIVLDNAVDAEHVRPLIPGQGGSLVLITSRVQLADLDSTGSLSLGVLPAAEAGELFLREAGAGGPGTADADAGVTLRQEVAEVVRRCGHLPLAIRIAGARLRHRPNWRIADLIEKLAESAVDEQDLVASAFAMSYARLEPEQRRMFRMLGLHPGTDIDVFAAAALAGAPRRTAGHLLESLLSSHLIEQRAAGRYSFHDLMREYARGRSAAAEDPPMDRHAQARLIDHYLYTASTAVNLIAPASRGRRPTIDPPSTDTPPLQDAAAALAWLEVERANLLTAAVLAGEQGRPSQVVQFSHILWRYLYNGGRHLDALALHTLAVGTARAEGDRKGLTHALRAFGLTCHQLGRFDDASAALTEARDLCEDPLDLAAAVEYLGNLTMTQGLYTQAVAHFEQSLSLWRADGFLLGIGNDLGNLGIAHFRRGDYEAARRLTVEALGLHVEHGHTSAQAQSSIWLSIVDERTGQYARGREEADRGLELARTLGLPAFEADALETRGLCLLRLDRPDEALDDLVGSLDLRRRHLDRLPIPDSLLALGVYHEHCDAPARALDYFRQSLDAAEDLDKTDAVIPALTGLGRALTASHDPESALVPLRRALELAGRTDEPDPYLLARVQEGLGRALGALGDSGGADHLRLAREAYLRLGVPDVARIDG